ncbi:hypothetical protein ACVWZD_001100 [Streptomyces sp. TE3672]
MVMPGWRFFFIQRTGKLKIVDQETLEGHLGAGSRVLVGDDSQADRLLGLVHNSKFEENHWIDLLHSEKTEKQAESVAAH